MTKKKQDKVGFKGYYLQGEGPGVMALLPFSPDEKEEKKGEKKVSPEDEDTSHLSDERNHKHSPFPQKRRRSYSFVR